MDLNSRLFDSIRIKPSCDDAKETGPVCEPPGCGRPGLYRAPKGRKASLMCRVRSPPVTDGRI